MTRRRRVQIPAKLRWRVLERDGFRCVYCGDLPPDSRIQVDHVRPVSRGGSNDEGNLVVACRRCNIGKSDSPAGSGIRQSVRRDAIYERASRIVREALEVTGGDCADYIFDRAVLYVARMIHDGFTRKHWRPLLEGARTNGIEWWCAQVIEQGELMEWTTGSGPSMRAMLMWRG